MHTLIMGLFDTSEAAAAAATALRALGIARERVSIVARSHDEEVGVARSADASPGAEIEDSPAASRLGELGAHLVAAVALIMPGIGPIVADGPLAAELGEVAGHAAGGVARTLQRTGMAASDAGHIQACIESGNLLVGAHVEQITVDPIAAVLTRAGASNVYRTAWPDSQEDARGV